MKFYGVFSKKDALITDGGQMLIYCRKKYAVEEARKKDGETVSEITTTKKES